ncbi:MAG TPA: zinc-binding dehydrogenase, partial [Planctomycetota bacterium]|nr:zinc-binding dehydrogenase [Planctomycetota bacterium]
ALVKLPKEVDPVWAMGEPLACTVHAGARFCIRPGDRVAVVGSGFMGLLCLQLARLMGAGSLAAFDLLPWRLETARKFGAQLTFVPPPDGPQTVIRDAGECHVVIEAAGTQSALDMCTDLVAFHGRLLIVGYHQSNNGMRSVPMALWNWKAIDVINGHVRRDDEKRDAMAAGIEMIRSGGLDMKSLVTCYPFDGMNTAFADLMARKPGLFKAGITFAA